MKNTLLFTPNKAVDTLLQQIVPGHKVRYFKANETLLPCDLIYIYTRPERILKEFNACLPAVHNDSLVIVDTSSCRQKEIKDIWEQIKGHDKVTVTIDSFFFRFVFFRKGQAKEHFTIRI